MEEDLIRRYLKGELSESEEQSFELRRQNDSDFSSLVDEFQSLQKGIRLAKRDALKQRLQEIESTEKSKSNFMRVAIAASIAILLGIGGTILWNQLQTTPEQLYAEYYEPYPNVHAPITRDAGVTSALEQAFEHYELEEYQEALEGFNYELTQTDDQDVLFYKGMTLIQLERDKDAMDILKKVDKNNTAYYPQLLWYQALLYIKMDQPENAKVQLEKLKSMKSGYKTKKVIELLNKLD